MKDLYKTLGVAEDADEDTIKKAYRKLAKENHPDVTGGDKRRPSASRRSTRPTRVLGDKQKRAGVRPAQARARSARTACPWASIADTFAQVFGGGLRAGRRAAMCG